MQSRQSFAQPFGANLLGLRLAALAIMAGLPVAGYLWLMGDGLARAAQAGLLGAVLASLGGRLLIGVPLNRAARGIDASRRHPLAGNARLHPGDGELASIRLGLRDAEWRLARSTAASVGAARLSHDLRGLLSPAMLAAERVQMKADPSLSRSGEIIVRALDRSTELLRHGFNFLRENAPPPPRARFPVCDALAQAADQAADQVAAQAGPLRPRLQVAVHVEASVQVMANQAGVVTALFELLRNASEAGAAQVVVTNVSQGHELALSLADDGPGLPDHVAAAAFGPVADPGQEPPGPPTGFGLAIARELLRAQSGDLVLMQTGPQGTVFKASLPIAT